jgi:lysosomal Pro-X carboxypeptidase
MPFGSKAKAYNNSKSLAYLTAEQALADFAVLLTDLKRNLSAESSPVVLFGGSYGGSECFLDYSSAKSALFFFVFFKI